MPQAAASGPGESRRRQVTVTGTVPADPLPPTSLRPNESDDEPQSRRRRIEADPMARSSSDNIEPDSFHPNDSSEDVNNIPTATAQQSQSAQSGGAVSAEASSPVSTAVQSYTATFYGPLAPPPDISLPDDRPLFSLDGQMWIQAVDSNDFSNNSRKLRVLPSLCTCHQLESPSGHLTTRTRTNTVGLADPRSPRHLSLPSS